MKDRSINYRLRKVVLKFYEIAIGKFVADLRISESKKLGLKERFDEPMTKTHNRNINEIGALGEIAVAKYLNQYFGGTVNTFHSLADVGVNVEVRATSKSHQKLIIREKDSDESYFFLVYQKSEEIYKILGFIKGSDGKKEEYYTEGWNGRPPAYFVPQDKLMKATLENLRKEKLMV